MQATAPFAPITQGELTAYQRNYEQEANHKATGRPHKTFYDARCTCGKEIVISRRSLLENKHPSCGCKPLTHGDTKTRLHNIWLDLRRRCNNPNRPDYRWYGARGITVCEEWNQDYKAFRSWALANGYQDHLTIDRIDTNRPYEPTNCRWATQLQQANNTTKNINITLQNQTQTLAEWVRHFGLCYTTVYCRYARGDRGMHLFRSPGAMVS